MSDGKGTEKHRSRRIYNAQLNFYRFRNWRIVRAEDDEGRVCEQVMIPMLQNGIRLNAKEQPTMALIIAKPPFPKGQSIATLFPYITDDSYQKMIEQGYASPDDESRADAVGFLFPPFDSYRKKKEEQLKKKMNE